VLASFNWYPSSIFTDEGEGPEIEAVKLEGETWMMLTSVKDLVVPKLSVSVKVTLYVPGTEYLILGVSVVELVGIPPGKLQSLVKGRAPVLVSVKSTV
jgi:hypothetical protein